ncbi:hypothetical protein ATE47_04020 [Chryseobacterium sp. IHB B 17019]|uniref:DNA cytosine methyltransferase n=1 Tax=Chryseobacterium sp. IHB B 17019 TaxID=1721091 RepID=UPI0007219073|nr:DNA cytosine methyltransferase [Chryseobacterium sp. IHB B 17019]ALR32483.1 hypothetical protein ATE47_04020 [Chryseobacterium sp. IHB B 17019]
MNILELFSGIGGFSKGFENAGFKIENHYFSEIDKHAIANYKHNFPNAKHIGSVTDISGRNFKGIDIITFGSPCQDFSLAGKREGMDGKRSVLILEAIRLVTELRPPVFIWENVKGAFSSNSGADFWGILQAFANIGGYRLEWQLLNTKWFLPQNRERIYLVGHLTGSERSFGNVFPISEDNCGINEGSIETRSIRTLTAGGNSGGLHSSKTLVQMAAIRGRDNQQGKIEQNLEINKESISNSLTSVQKDNVVIQINNSKKWKGSTPDRERVYHTKGVAPCLGSSMGTGGNLVPKFLFEKNIRRLTEIECERLQGFPDNFTKYGVYEKQVWTNKKEGTFKIIQDVQEIPKTQRYKMLGNAVTVKVVEEIAKRLRSI